MHGEAKVDIWEFYLVVLDESFAVIYLLFKNRDPSKKIWQCQYGYVGPRSCFRGASTGFWSFVANSRSVQMRVNKEDEMVLNICATRLPTWIDHQRCAAEAGLSSRCVCMPGNAENRFNHLFWDVLSKELEESDGDEVLWEDVVRHAG